MIKKTIKEALEWWLTGLAYLLPESVRLRLRHSSNRLFINFENDSYHFALYKNVAPAPSADWTMQRADESSIAITRRHLNALIDEDVFVVLAIPVTMLLVKTLMLPIGADGNVRDVLRYEMDRQTPFTADKVYFDWLIIKKDYDNNKLNIKLFIILKEILEPLLNEIHSVQLEPDIVTTMPVEHASGINLLSEKSRNHSNDQIGYRTRILALITLGLFLGTLYFPLLRQEEVLRSAEAKISTLRNEANKTRVLINERDVLQSRARFLDDKRQARLAAIDILNKLTQLLPDNTYLDRMMLRGEEIEIYGESSDATSLIQLIEGSDIFSNAQFEAPVTKNISTGKERFQLSANISKGRAG